MGYALMFARTLQNTARKNRLNYETMDIQNRQDNITKQISQLQNIENALKAQTQADGGVSPDLMYLEMHREMLTLMSKNLDARLKCIQTQLSRIAAKEKSNEEVLAAQIEASTPKYMA